jgi:spermidine synthase
MLAWTTLDVADTPDGRLELRRRGEKDTLITLDGRVLMSSMLHRSEVELGKLGCVPIRTRNTPSVLTAGLGLGFTLRAVLDHLPPSATVVVAELNDVVVKWCQGPAASLSSEALADPRVHLFVGDVMACVHDVARSQRPPFDAVVIDLYVGPGRDPRGVYNALYGEAALATVYASLTPGGIYAVWGEDFEPSFDAALQRAGFRTTHARPRRPGRRHVIYVATKPC